MITNDERDYYKKNLELPNIDVNGQIKLKKARVLVLGAGGLGCPALLYLATSGVGNIGIVDFDTVSISNLHRQILYNYSDVGQSKAKVASDKLKRINPYINIEFYHTYIDEHNVDELIENYDIILDAPDNFQTRYIIEYACCKKKKTIIHASVSRFEGQVSVFTPETACYNCIFPPIPSKNSVNENKKNEIFGPVTGIIGTLQAMEAIKLIVGVGQPLTNKLLCYNSLNQKIRQINVTKDPNCLVCGNTRGDKNV